MDIWVISDTHFGHDRLVELAGRPADFTARIVTNWKRLVKPADLVLHLGDVAFETEGLTALIASLPGRKIVVRGNHDNRPAWLMHRGFDFGCDYFVYRRVAFSHKPLVPIPYGAAFNVHGHFHDGTHRLGEYASVPGFSAARERYVLVSIEQTLAPVRLETLIPNIWARAKQWCIDHGETAVP